MFNNFHQDRASMLERVTNQVNCKFSNKVLTVLCCLLCNEKFSPVTGDPQMSDMSDPDTFVLYFPVFFSLSHCTPTHKWFASCSSCDCDGWRHSSYRTHKNIYRTSNKLQQAFLLIFAAHASLFHPRISVEAITTVGRYWNAPVKEGSLLQYETPSSAIFRYDIYQLSNYPLISY